MPGTCCDGMDVLDVHHVVTRLASAREDREPQLVEAVTYRYRGHSMADPEEYRSKEEVEQWRERDPIMAFSKRLVDEGALAKEAVEQLDRDAIVTVDEAVAFADDSPFPELDALYDDVYVYSGSARLVDRRRANPRGASRRARARGRPGAPRAGGEGRRARERRRRTGAKAATSGRSPDR